MRAILSFQQVQPVFEGESVRGGTEVTALKMGRLAPC